MPRAWLAIAILGCTLNVALAEASTPAHLATSTASWREHDDVIEGWDWSLPPQVWPAPFSGLIYGKSHSQSVPGNRLMQLMWSWRQLEPREGEFDFDALRDAVEKSKPEYDGVILRLHASVYDIVRADKPDLSEGSVPLWLVEKHQLPAIPMRPMRTGAARFEVRNVPIWDPRYHQAYLNMLDALGRSGILQMEQVKGAMVLGISRSRGEEHAVPYLPQSLLDEYGYDAAHHEQVMRERVDAWARAAQGCEHKLIWIGRGSHDLYTDPVGDRLLRHAYELGMGQRNGFVEMYLYHYDSPGLGQRLDPEGYLVVDETCPPIAGRRAFLDENEEYNPNLDPERFGPVDHWQTRYRESMLRALQMRRNFLWIEYNLTMNPALAGFVGLELGRTVADTPDVWCYLRESYVTPRGLPVKNFERWLHQRDRDGWRTIPAVAIDQPSPRFSLEAPPALRHDCIARRTDSASGNRRIGFALDDRFLFDEPSRVAVKVTYHDVAPARWRLRYTTAQREASRQIDATGAGALKTATFFLEDARFNARGEAFDFSIEALEGDAVISFVRIIKLPPADPTTGGRD